MLNTSETYCKLGIVMRARVLVLYRPSVRIMIMIMIIVYLQAQLHPDFGDTRHAMLNTSETYCKLDIIMRARVLVLYRPSVRIMIIIIIIIYLQAQLHPDFGDTRHAMLNTSETYCKLGIIMRARVLVLYKQSVRIIIIIIIMFYLQTQLRPGLTVRARRPNLLQRQRIKKNKKMPARVLVIHKPSVSIMMMIIFYLQTQLCPGSTACATRRHLLQ